MLVIVENRNVDFFFQPSLDLETAGAEIYSKLMPPQDPAKNLMVLMISSVSLERMQRGCLLITMFCRERREK